MIKEKIIKYQYLLEIISLSIIMFIAFLLNGKWNYLAGILLITYALSTYLIISIVNRNMFDLSAVILAAWICPLGLSLFRIASYQQPWELETWVCYYLLPACFILGYAMRKKILNLILNYVSKIKVSSSFKAEGREKLLFWFAIICFSLGLLTVLAKWYAAGELPIFSSDYDAYSTFIASTNYFDIGKKLENIPVLSNLYYLFLSKGWIFFYQLWLVPAILLIYAEKYTNSKVKKVIGIFISILTIIITLITVSRELFLMIMVTLAVILYNLYGKKIRIVIMMVFLSLGGFALLSIARNVSTEAINQVMYITENPNYTPKKDKEIDNKVIVEDKNVSSNEVSYSKPLPGIVVWAYGYFTSGYDNMNHLIKTLDKHFYGAMQLNPLFIITGSERLRNMPEVINQEKYQVAPGLTIYTFMKDAYVDFGTIGVIISMFIWGLLFGLFAEGFNKYKNDLCLIIYACFVHHIVFISFVSWMTHFSYLFSIFILIVLYLILKYNIASKKSIVRLKERN